MQYPVSLGVLSGNAAANMLRFDLGTELSGDMEILLTTISFNDLTMLGFALTTNPNDALYNNPSPFLDLLDPEADVRDFFNKNVLGWRLYAYESDNIAPGGGTSNLTDSYDPPLQFYPNLHYYAFVAGGSLAGEKVNFSLTVNNASASVVPIPAAVWLFGSGIVGLIGASKRKIA